MKFSLVGERLGRWENTQSRLDYRLEAISDLSERSRSCFMGKYCWTLLPLSRNCYG